MSLPPLPPGATLDDGGGLPPLPPGATLDGAGGPESPDSWKAQATRLSDGTWLSHGVHVDESGTPVEAGAVRAKLEEANGRESMLEKVLTFAHGASNSLGPQVAGILGAVQGKDFAAERAKAKQAVDLAREHAGVGYEVAGNLATTGLLAPETAVERVGLQGMLGAANSAAESNGDSNEALKGAGLGVLAGGLGEGIAYGLGKGIEKLRGTAAAAVSKQAAKDAAAVEKDLASTVGKLGGETQRGSRLVENLQRFRSAGSPVGAEARAAIKDALAGPEAKELAEGVAASNLGDLPTQKGVIDALRAEVAEKAATVEARARAATGEYFSKPVWGEEVVPRIKTLAPRFGLSAMGALAGQAWGEVSGGEAHPGTGAFIGAVLGAPGVRQMMKNVANSPRIQLAVATRLTPLLQAAATFVTRGLVPTARELGAASLHESALGSPDLAAEQLASRGGLKALVGDNAVDVGHATGLNAPQSPLDAAIHRTVGVAAMAGAIDDHHAKVESAAKKFLRGEPIVKPRGGEVHPDVSALQASPETLIDRFANNTGSLSAVAPAVTASMAGVAQRAVQHLASLSSAPAQSGPLASEWIPSAAEKRAHADAAAIVDDPLVLFAHAQAGTLTARHLETAQAVYPLLTRTLGDKAIDLAIESGKTLPYRTRMMLSILSGVDVDGSIRGTAANQVACARQSVKPSIQGSPGTAGASKLTLGQRMGERHNREREEV